MNLNRFLSGRKSLLVSLVTLVALSGAFFLWGFTNTPSASDEAEIQNLIRHAETVIPKLVTLPPAYHDPLIPVPASVRAAAEQRIEEELREIYSASSPLLSQRIGALKGAIQGQLNDGFRQVASGIKSIEFKSIKVDGNTAVAIVRIHNWVRLTGVTPGTFDEPEALATHTFNLIKENGRWKITRHTWEYAPEGPRP